LEKIDYEKLFKRSKNYAYKKGLQEQDCEDFAQEVLIRQFRCAVHVKIEYVYLNFRDFSRADKRILSSSCGQLSNFRTVSTSTPLDNSNQNSATLGDLIADPGNLSRSIEEGRDLMAYVNCIFNFIKNEKTKEWAKKEYQRWLFENVF